MIPNTPELLPGAPIARCSNCARTLDDPKIETIWANKRGRVRCDRCRALKAAEDALVPERFL